MPETHVEYRPSLFPAWMQCAGYDSSDVPTPEAEYGTLMHKAIQAMLSGAPPVRIDDGDVDTVEWAVSTIRDIIRARGHDESHIACEVEVHLTSETGEIITVGHIDVACGDVIIDIKTGSHRNYYPQLSTYAAAWGQETERDRVHVVELYTRDRMAIGYDVTVAEGLTIATTAISRRKEAERTGAGLSPCEYCTWCAHRGECQAVQQVLPTPAGITVSEPVAQMSPAVISTALSSVVPAVEAWVDEVKARAKELLSSGTDVPGWTLETRSGRRVVTNAREAIDRLSDLGDGIWGAVSISVADAEAVAAKALGLKKADASRLIADRLGTLIVRQQDTVMLKRKREGK